MLEKVMILLNLLQSGIKISAKVYIRSTEKDRMEIMVKTNIRGKSYSQTRVITMEEIADCQDEMGLIAGFIYGINHQHERIYE